MNEVIPTNLKEWLSWKSDNSYEERIGYIRVYTVPDKEELLFLRHIEEHKKIQNGDTKKVEYSIITKVKGSFNAQTGWKPECYDHCKALMNDNQVFNFHSGESDNLEMFLHMFLMKKADKIIIDYYENNDSDFIKKLGYHQESVYFSFQVKKKKYRIEISHIPNSDLTKYLHYNCTEYKTKELYEEVYPVKSEIITSSCTVMKEQSPIIEA